MATRDPKSGLVIYAKDLRRVAAFYAGLLGIAPAHADDVFVTLELPGLQLVVHQIPPHIAAGIVIAGLFILPNHRAQSVKPIDVLGSLLLVGMILSLLYGLRNLDFFDFGTSIRSTDVWPFLVTFAALLPVFLLAERRAADRPGRLRPATASPGPGRCATRREMSSCWRRTPITGKAARTTAVASWGTKSATTAGCRSPLP